jgi:hypothetical protein
MGCYIGYKSKVIVKYCSIVHHLGTSVTLGL